MANKKPNNTSRGGTMLDRASRLSYGQLFLYLAVFFVGGAVLAFGLYTGALGGEGGGTMTVMGVISVLLCAVSVLFFIAALMKKRRERPRRLSK